jgi:hypothetical protein
MVMPAVGSAKTGWMLKKGGIRASRGATALLRKGAAVLRGAGALETSEAVALLGGGIFTGTICNSRARIAATTKVRWTGLQLRGTPTNWTHGIGIRSRLNAARIRPDTVTVITKRQAAVLI